MPYRPPVLTGLSLVAACLLVGGVVSGCGGDAQRAGTREPVAQAAGGGGGGAVLPQTAGAPSSGTSLGGQSPADPAPGTTEFGVIERRYAVGVRNLSLRRRQDRPLPTVVWYPAAGPAELDPIPDAAPAAGRFPVVMFSHGLRGLPEHYLALTTRWAAAGFVVVAPVYPYTNQNASRFDRNDVPNQVIDAGFVLGEVLRLGVRSGDPFAGHLDPARSCATGYSAGGFTTSGMFTAGRDSRLRCAIVIAAGAVEGGFTGPPVPVLFVHGDADRTVIYARGRAAYDQLRWPKALLTLHGQDHGSYLGTGGSGYLQLLRTTTDFLRWTLNGDSAARRRLPADAALPGVASLSSALGG